MTLYNSLVGKICHFFPTLDDKEGQILTLSDQAVVFCHLVQKCESLNLISDGVIADRLIIKN